MQQLLRYKIYRTLPNNKCQLATHTRQKTSTYRGRLIRYVQQTNQPFSFFLILQKPRLGHKNCKSKRNLWIVIILQFCAVEASHQSSNKLQTSRIIVYILAAGGTEAHPTPYTSIIGRESTNSAEMSAGNGTWRPNSCSQIGGHMRRQGLQVCLFV